MELPRVVFFGRGGSDTLQFFDLDLADWRGARILDYPGGLRSPPVCYAPLADGGLFQQNCINRWSPY